MGIDGYLLLPGLALGAAQALVLRRHLSNRVIGPWVVASIFGWSFGLVLVFLLALLLALVFGAGEGVPEFTERAGPVIAEIDQTEYSKGQPFYLAIWASLALSQGLALAFVLSALEGWARRASFSLAVLWVLVGVAGGALGVAADLYVSVAVFPGEDRGLLGRVALPAAALAVAGVLYAAATGVVLSMIVRRTTPQEGDA